MRKRYANNMQFWAPMKLVKLKCKWRHKSPWFVFRTVLQSVSNIALNKLLVSCWYCFFIPTTKLGYLIYCEFCRHYLRSSERKVLMAYCLSLHTWLLFLFCGESHFVVITWYKIWDRIHCVVNRVILGHFILDLFVYIVFTILFTVNYAIFI